MSKAAVNPQDSHAPDDTSALQSSAAVRERAWAGNHAKAIELATQALAAPRIKPAERMLLLDLRAESYVAQGALDLAGQDAAAMLALADARQTPALHAQALNRQALVQMRRGKLHEAVESASAAVKAAV